MRILAGDIGGTNTRLALFDADGRLLCPLQKFPSKNYPNLSTIVAEFLSEEKVDVACFGIAGPIEGGLCRATNLPWIVDSRILQEENSIGSVHLINDLLANAYGITRLQEGDLLTLHAGDPEKGNKALISPGTGLGEAGMIFVDGAFHPFASEGGHVDFAPTNALQEELLHSLRSAFSHVSYQRVLSGPGLATIYRFLVEKKSMPPLEKVASSKNLPEEITQAAKEKSSPTCVEALQIFVSIYGSEAGNLALKFLSLSGMYLGGGIVPHIVDIIKEGAFMRAFCNKGRFHTLLEKIPVRIVLNDQAALLGALEYALQKHGL